MNKEQIRTYYCRFRRWQQTTPHFADRHEGAVQHCCNCGHEFVGNFCPICGQRAEVGHVGWNAIRENITLLWGLDSRSLSYTLVQLLGRPGYLVRDYISGHRQVSFPPVKMLVLICLLLVIFEAVFHMENDVLGITFNVKEIDDVIAWINSQKSWATLLIQSFLILPTWLVFRFAPSYPRHTLPEGFFLQVFLSVQSLLLSFFGYWSNHAELAFCMVYTYITYHQLFGYGWWGTLWRQVVVILTQLASMLAIVVVVIFFFVYDIAHESGRDTIIAFLFWLGVTVLFAAVILFVTHRINRRTYK